MERTNSIITNDTVRIALLLTTPKIDNGHYWAKIVIKTVRDTNLSSCCEKCHVGYIYRGISFWNVVSILLWRFCHLQKFLIIVSVETIIILHIWTLTKLSPRNILRLWRWLQLLSYEFVKIAIEIDRPLYNNFLYVATKCISIHTYLWRETNKTYRWRMQVVWNTKWV